MIKKIWLELDTEHLMYMLCRDIPRIQTAIKKNLKYIW